MSGNGRADVGERVGTRGSEEMRNAQHVNPYLLLSSRSFIVLLKQSQNDTWERSSDISSVEIMNIMTRYAAAADQHEHYDMLRSCC